MTTLRHLDEVPRAIHYPSSDGKPMAETDLHWLAMVDLTLRLRHRYAEQPDVYVASNNLIYYEEGNPRRCFSPDVYVVLGAPKGVRRIYKVWEEGRPPTVVFEMSSRKTRREDLGPKRELCARLGIAEYWLFDPEHDYLDPPLQGYRLVGTNYQAIGADAAGHLISTSLGLRLAVDGASIAPFDLATGEALLPPDERAAVAEAARADAESRIEAAEAELARLRAELNSLRSKPQSP
jgi:Uma2 family endonuclease